MPQDQILTDTERKKFRVLPAYSLHLDLIRGIAALLVFLGHLHVVVYRHMNVVIQGEKSNITAHPADSTGLGHAAVVVFFVLSGYLVGGSVLRDLKRNSFSWTSYTLRRLVRLWTVLIPVLILGALIDVISLHFFSTTHSFVGGEFSKNIHGFPSVSLFLRYLFFMQTVARVGPSHFGSNGALWSLSCEFWYYAIFPPLAFCLLSSRSSKVARVAFGLFVAASLWFVGARISFYFPLWLLGVAAYLVPPKIPQAFQRAVNFVLVLQFLVVLFLLRSIVVGALRADIILATSFTLMLYGILHRTGPAATSWYSRLAHGLSFPSYTLYASHLPMAVLLTAFVEVTFPQLFARHLMVTGIISVLVFAYAVVQYLIFERNTDRIRHLIETRFFRNRVKPRLENAPVGT